MAPVTNERSLSFPCFLLAPKKPDLNICHSKKRDGEKFRIHKDCNAADECTKCVWNSEAVVQAYWRLQLLPLLQPHMQSATLVDRHAHSSLPPSSFTNELSPDIVLYRSTMPTIDFYIISVGEIKFGVNITAEHCGQLAKYVQALFDLHPHRRRLCAWLATQDKMRLFKFEVDDNRNISSVETSQDFGYDDGLQHLCSMLRLNLPELGVFEGPIPMPGNPNVGLLPVRFLGRGSFATAYAAIKPGSEDTVVIKVFRGGANGALALQCEQQTLSHLKEVNIKGVTKLVGSVAYPPQSQVAAAAEAALAPLSTMLVLEPEGVTLDRVVRDRQRNTNYRLTCMLSLCLRVSYNCADDAICKLLAIVKDVHVLGHVVHCDLSLSNMYFLPDGNVRARVIRLLT